AADRGALATGDVVAPCTDRGKRATDLVAYPDYYASETREILPDPYHHVVRARACISALGAAQFVVAHDQIAKPIRRLCPPQPMRTSCPPQALCVGQVRPGDDALVGRISEGHGCELMLHGSHACGHPPWLGVRRLA